MGTFWGHIAHGLPMVAIGLWHIFNTSHNYARSPKNFQSRPWFPVHTKPLSKYTELYTIMALTLTSITAELFVTPARHTPWGPDGSIPLSHMNRMEHATIALTFFVYAAVAAAAEKMHIATPAGVVNVMAALGFAQELLLFHFHSSAAVGVEKHYHWLLQVIVGVCMGSAVVEAAWPEKLLAALLRAAAVTMQGVWLLHMAFVLWIPATIPVGCRLQRSKDVFVAKCEGGEATARAIAVANLQFSWDMLVVVLVTLGFLFYGCYGVGKSSRKVEGYRAVEYKEYDMESLERGCSSPLQNESYHDTCHV